ncbi:carcinine hydrolase/isopenicillin-N N-acyltransferase family protein [Eubacteriales bacterium DFI.9.88]|nr:carcinine hydrolase/isopenicillin-N N-acyltransferase family protein [Eubacteriales bacterium DFI.9.88]
MKKNAGTSRSCSTLIALQSATEQGDIIFGKNSDRPVNESQPLEYYPPADHQPGEMVQCTYIKIPQVEHTFGYIGSRPYNIFGFEHGINEHGVIIGNEAVTGRETPERQWGLIGMDMLRLALERADSAAKAVEIIGRLLETYGTGGDPLIRPQYFNANYIIADYEEAYIFESCQRMWAAKKIDHVGHIGNIYALTDDYQMIGSQVIEEASKKGWCRKEDRINISQTFSISDCDYEDGEAYFRYIRQEELMTGREPFTVKMMMNNLRDHYDLSYRKPLPYDIATSKMPTICCHPGGMNGCASAASVVCSLDKDAADPFKFVYWGSMAPPCCSIFTPKFNIGWIPQELADADGMYNPDSPWWTFTELERYIALSYDDFAPMAREVFNPMEEEFILQVESAKKEFDGNKEKLKELSQEAFTRSLESARELTKKIKGRLAQTRINYLMLDYFRDSAAGCNMPYDQSLIERIGK